MHNRRSTLLLTGTLVLTGIAVAVWSLAGGTPRLPDVDSPPPPRAEAPAGPDADVLPGPAGRGAGSDAPAEITPRVEPRPPVDPASDKGMISGRITVSTRLLDKLSRYTIVVQEDVNTNGRRPEDPRPFQRQETFPANRHRSTPYFDIVGIPFSRHPYHVTVLAEGMNGSSARTYITAESPTGSDGDVQLALTPGSYFNVLLRDQRQNPRPNLKVRMVPVGAELTQRETLFGESDGGGARLFENVLQGDWEIRVGFDGALLAPPQKVTVYANFNPRDLDGRPTVQGATVIVPDGLDVTVEVFSQYGYPVEGAELKAWQLEVKRWYEFTGKTDRAGRFVFEHMPFGTYQLHVERGQNGMRDIKFKVEQNEPPPEVQVKLPR